MKKIYVAIFLLWLSIVVVIPIQAQEMQRTITVNSTLYKDLAELKYPVISGMEEDKVKKKINTIFKQYIESSYEEWKENKKQAEEHDFRSDYQTDYEVKYNTYPKLSVLTSNYIYSGGAHGNTTVESFNFDLEKGKRIYLTSILTEEEQLKAVQHYVWEYAIERPDVFYPDLKKEDIQLSDNTAFYFTDNGITLVFQQYEIAPYVSGNQEITIPQEIYNEKILK